VSNESDRYTELSKDQAMIRDFLDWSSTCNQESRFEGVVRNHQTRSVIDRSHLREVNHSKIGQNESYLELLYLNSLCIYRAIRNPKGTEGPEGEGERKRER